MNRECFIIYLIVATWVGVNIIAAYMSIVEFDARAAAQLVSNRSIQSP